MYQGQVLDYFCRFGFRKKNPVNFVKLWNTDYNMDIFQSSQEITGNAQSSRPSTRTLNMD